MLSSFFSSIQTTLTRVMDPNEYDSLLSTLVADFENINSGIIVFALVLLAGLIFVLRRDLALLDVLTLGKHQAINLGVDYDRSIRRLLLGVTLCIAVATAMVGPISFLGLIIANIARQLFKTYRHTLSDSGLRPGGHGGAGGGTACGGAYLPLTRCPSACSSPWAAASTFSIFFCPTGGCNPCVSRI